MTARFVLALALRSLAQTPQLPQPPYSAAMCVRVDSLRHEVIITAGPFRVPAQQHVHAAMRDVGATAAGPEEIFVQRFAWPATVWVHGYRLRLFDARGRPAERRRIHHLYLIDFDRRELVYPIAQRVLGLGGETPDFTLRSKAGILLPAGHDLGLYVMWHNDTGVDLDSVRLELAFRWVEPEPGASLLTVFPFFVDAHPVLGADWTFTIPPGGGGASYEFALPVSGRLRAVGGHLHDHGVALRLEDAATDEAIVTIRAQRDSVGRLLGMPYRVLAVGDSGPHLVAGRRYRLVATYDNPTPDPLPAMMGTLAGLFAPDDPLRWPPIDPRDPSFVQDQALLTTSHPGGGPVALPCPRSER